MTPGSLHVVILKAGSFRRAVTSVVMSTVVMSRVLLAPLVAATLSLPAQQVPAVARATDTLPAGARLRLFLLVGQSNMAGRGTVEAEDSMPVAHVWMLTQGGAWSPAVEPMHFDKPRVAGVGPGRAFGLAVAQAWKGTEIGMVPAAVGGSSIRAWEPGAADSATNTHPYDDAIARARLAMQRGSLAGILWLQGESDGNPRNAGDYEQCLLPVIANLRGDLQAPHVRFSSGRWDAFPRSRGTPTARAWTLRTGRLRPPHRTQRSFSPKGCGIVATPFTPTHGRRARSGDATRRSSSS